VGGEEPFLWEMREPANWCGDYFYIQRGRHGEASRGKRSDARGKKIASHGPTVSCQKKGERPRKGKGVTTYIGGLADQSDGHCKIGGKNVIYCAEGTQEKGIHGQAGLKGENHKTISAVKCRGFPSRRKNKEEGSQFSGGGPFNAKRKLKS